MGLVDVWLYCLPSFSDWPGLGDLCLNKIRGIRGYLSVGFGRGSRVRWRGSRVEGRGSRVEGRGPRVKG